MTLPSASFADAISLPPPTSLTTRCASAPVSSSALRPSSMSRRVSRAEARHLLAVTTGLQSYILVLFHPDWSHWLAPSIAILGLGAAASFVVARPKPRNEGQWPSAGPSRDKRRSIVHTARPGDLGHLYGATSTVWYGAKPDRRPPVLRQKLVKRLAGWVAGSGSC
jgi:hypothetical protein